MVNRYAEAEDRKVIPKFTPRFIVCIGCDRAPYCRRIDTIVYQDYKIVNGEVMWTYITTRVNMIIISSIRKRGYCPDHTAL